MAGQDWRSPSDLKGDLLQRGHEFSFFQVMRLLRLIHPDPEGLAESDASDLQRIRIHPELSLAFPASDVAKIEEETGEEPKFFVTTTFLGLYGPSSPLPTFYTEDLLHEAIEDLSVTRDFIDLVNHRIFFLLFRCWTKYRQFLQVVEEKNPRDLERLFCLLGLGETELRQGIPQAYFLLRYLGLFTQFPRSASGLATLLQDALGGLPVTVMSCVERRVRIPADQRSFLGTSGNRLGVDSLLGDEIDDRMGKFRLQMGPLTSEQFHSLLPGNPHHQRLALLTRFYLLDPLEYDLLLTVAEGEGQTVCLGSAHWAMLGWDTWVFSSGSLGQVQTILSSQDR